MAEIAQMTFDSHDFLDVMDMLDRRMNDRGKMWRHVYKVEPSVTLLTPRRCKFSITVSIVDLKMLSGGARIIYTSSSLSENFSI